MLADQRVSVGDKVQREGRRWADKRSVKVEGSFASAKLRDHSTLPERYKTCDVIKLLPSSVWALPAPVCCSNDQ